MLPRISSSRMISHPVRLLHSRNLSVLTDTIHNLLPFEMSRPILEASKGGLVATVTSKAHQKIIEKNPQNNNKKEHFSDDSNPQKTKLNYSKLFLTALNNIITILFLDWEFSKVKEKAKNYLNETKEHYLNAKDPSKSEEEVQDYISFSTWENTYNNYEECLKNIKNALLSANLKVKKSFKNRSQVPFTTEIFPSTPYMLYQRMCCEKIKYSDFKETYSDVKKNVTNKESKLHKGLKKIGTALCLELVCQLLQNNIIGKILFSTNLLPKNLTDKIFEKTSFSTNFVVKKLKDSIFKTLCQNIILSLKKLIVLKGVEVAFENLALNEDSEKNESKKQDSD